jgi:flavin-dependent dehydrogenase
MVDAEVLVVGGGPAGSSVAFALARAGVDVLVLDRARFPRSKPCAESLSPEASRILHDMGALAAIERAGAAKLAGIRVHAPDGTIVAGDFVADHGYHGHSTYGLSVRREILDAIVLECARDSGARVIESIRVTDVLRDARGRVVGVDTLTPGGRRQLHARLVVGADGLRSVVARRLGLAHSFRWPRRLALVTHYRGVAGVADHGEMHVFRDDFVGIADVGNGLTTVALVIPARRSRDISGDRAGFLDSWLRSKPSLGPRFKQAERATPVVATGPFASHARRAWAPGSALVGDAADFFDPFTGQGIYAALRGGELLAPMLRAALTAMTPRAADGELSQYDRARRREMRGKWFVERVIGAVVARPGLMNRAARNLSEHKPLADLLIGVTGDFVPAREVIRLSYVWNVFRPRADVAGRSAPAASPPAPVSHD